MALYFAMIDGERQGPFRLEQLRDAGVGPETYVWCKGMSDWEKAADVADICRYFRQHIFNLMHPVAETEPVREEPKRAEMEYSTRFGYSFPQPEEMPEDLERPPVSMLAPAIFLTLFCFPLTGFIAIYYSIFARRFWEEAKRSDSKYEGKLYSEEERKNCKRKAHDYERLSKMWVGITFFLGFILYAFLGFRL